MSAIRSKSRISGTSKKIGKWHCNNRLKCTAQLVKLCNSFEEFVLNSCQGQYLLYFVQWRSWPSLPHITSHTLCVQSDPNHASQISSQPASILDETRSPHDPMGIHTAFPPPLWETQYSRTTRQYFYLSYTV